MSVFSSTVTLRLWTLKSFKAPDSSLYFKSVLFCTEGASSCGLEEGNKTDDKIIKNCKQMKIITKICRCKQIRNLRTFIKIVHIVN